jgi:hypothetical protein
MYRMSMRNEMLMNINTPEAAGKQFGQQYDIVECIPCFRINGNGAAEVVSYELTHSNGKINVVRLGEVPGPWFVKGANWDALVQSH